MSDPTTAAAEPGAFPPESAPAPSKEETRRGDHDEEFEPRQRDLQEGHDNEGDHKDDEEDD
ncbi:MAG: hypothetical protein AB1679_01240 [Actinomycetota bacterium]